MFLYKEGVFALEKGAFALETGTFVAGTRWKRTYLQSSGGLFALKKGVLASEPGLPKAAFDPHLLRVRSVKLGDALLEKGEELWNKSSRGVNVSKGGSLQLWTPSRNGVLGRAHV